MARQRVNERDDPEFRAITYLKRVMSASVVVVVGEDLKAASSGKVTKTRNKKT